MLRYLFDAMSAPRTLLLASSFALLFTPLLMLLPCQRAPAAAPVVIVTPGLVEFEAVACGPCQRMKPIVARLAKAGERVTQIDVDRARGAASAYRITQTPTFLALDRHGREIGRIVGVASEQQLRALAQRIKK